MKLDQETRQSLLDAVLDLQHDLGKHIHLPLAWLPKDAPPAEVHRAARTALLQTRRGPGGVRPARRLWSEFRMEVGEALAELSSWRDLERAVVRALDWTAALDDPGLDRAALQADLAAVAPAIRALRAELEDD